MKIFRRIQIVIAIIALWTAITVSDNYAATNKEIFSSIVLVILGGVVIINVLIERSKEEAE